MKYIELNAGRLEKVIGTDLKKNTSDVDIKKIREDAEKLADFSEQVLLVTFDLSAKALVGFGKFLMWLVPRMKNFTMKCIKKVQKIKNKASKDIRKADSPEKVRKITKRAKKEIQKVQNIYIDKINIYVDKRGVIPNSVKKEFSEKELEDFVESYMS